MVHKNELAMSSAKEITSYTLRRVMKSTMNLFEMIQLCYGKFQRQGRIEKPSYVVFNFLAATGCSNHISKWVLAPFNDGFNIIYSRPVPTVYSIMNHTP